MPPDGGGPGGGGGAGGGAGPEGASGGAGGIETKTQKGIHQYASPNSSGSVTGSASSGLTTLTILIIVTNQSTGIIYDPQSYYKKRMSTHQRPTQDTQK